MTFSIIIPVYNVAPYLRECLDSVLAAANTLLKEEVRKKSEEVRGVEAICVDDGSTDGSGAILDEYVEKKVEKVGGGGQWNVPFKVIHQRNAGVSSARNAGFEASVGEWVLFMDSDDVLLPNALEKVADAIARNECEMVTFEMCRVKDIREVVPARVESCEKVHNMDNEADAVPFVRKNFPHRLWAWNKCIKRSLIGELRFENYQPCEDAVFTLLCMTRALRIVELPDVLYKYLQHDGSCLSHVSVKRVNGDINGMRRLTEVMGAWKFFGAVRGDVRQVMRSGFLVGLTHDMKSIGVDASVMAELEKCYAESVRKVFFGLPLFGAANRLFYRILFGRCSVVRVGRFLTCMEVISRFVHLPSRIAGKIKRVIIG